MSTKGMVLVLLELESVLVVVDVPEVEVDVAVVVVVDSCWLAVCPGIETRSSKTRHTRHDSVSHGYHMGSTPCAAQYHQACVVKIQGSVCVRVEEDVFEEDVELVNVLDVAVPDICLP